MGVSAKQIAAKFETDRGTFRTLLSLHSSSRLWNSVYERSEGIPFNIVHVERSLREAGITSLRDGKIILGTHATVEGLKALELPTSIKDLVKSRISNLSSDAQAVVFLASAIGSCFSLNLLHEAMAHAVSLEPWLWSQV